MRVLGLATRRSACTTPDSGGKKGTRPPTASCWAGYAGKAAPAPGSEALYSSPSGGRRLLQLDGFSQGEVAAVMRERAPSPTARSITTRERVAGLLAMRETPRRCATVTVGGCDYATATAAAATATAAATAAATATIEAGFGSDADADDHVGLDLAAEALARASRRAAAHENPSTEAKPPPPVPLAPISQPQLDMGHDGERAWWANSPSSDKISTDTAAGAAEAAAEVAKARASTAAIEAAESAARLRAVLEAQTLELRQTQRAVEQERIARVEAEASAVDAKNALAAALHEAQALRARLDGAREGEALRAELDATRRAAEAAEGARAVLAERAATLCAEVVLARKEWRAGTARLSLAVVG